MHKHHIIPKHMGGTDDESNLVSLSVDEHAEAHRILFEQHGKWQDFMAWKALSGQIGKDELRKELCRFANLGRPLSEEHKRKLSEANLGKKHSEETKKKMAASAKNYEVTWDLKNRTPESNQKRSKTMKGKPKPIITCPHCNKSGGKPQMKQWHFDNCKEKI